MLKTNSKTARANICAYLRETIENPAEIVENYNRNARLDPNAPDFGEWLVNYECALDIYYDEQRARLASVLEETPEEANRYDDAQVARLYKMLMSHGFKEAFGYGYTYELNRARHYVEILTEKEA